MRGELKQAQDELIEAEAELADQMADLRAFEQLYEARVGHLTGQLATLEAELLDQQQRLQSLRNLRDLGVDHVSVEDQYRQTWEVPGRAAAAEAPEALSAADAKQIKRLYRKLARRFHPDLANDPSERAYRTEKMAALNDAYTSRSLTEMVALASEPESVGPGQERAGQTELQMVEAVKEELARVRRRLREIRFEMTNLHNRPSVQLSLEAKFAQREGRDLLAEMANDLKRRIIQKGAELERVRSQLDQLGPEPRIGLT